LDDYGVAGTALLVATHLPRCWQAEDLAAYHDGQELCGANSAICSRIARISARSTSSAASRCTSAAIEERARRRAAVSRRAIRTASESLSPSPRMTLRAEAELSSKRTCSERLIVPDRSTYHATWTVVAFARPRSTPSPPLYGFVLAGQVHFSWRQTNHWSAMPLADRCGRTRACCRPPATRAPRNRPRRPCRHRRSGVVGTHR